MKTWTAVAERIRAGFESSTTKTPEFKAFASAFKAFLKKELATAGAELASFQVGHFGCSGFYQKNGKIGYFSISEVRDQCEFRLLYRSAKNLKDHSGGHNNFVDMSDPFTDCTKKLVALLN